MSATPAPLPLEGIIVVDFSWVAAAPLSTMLLGLQGAHVIKVEPVDRVDLSRAFSHSSGDPDMGPIYVTVNMGKKVVSLDLKQPEAVDLARGLVRKADIVVESMRPGKLAQLGLGYETFQVERPDLIMVSLSGFGQTGRESQYGAYASTFGVLGGISALTGYAGGIPTQIRASADIRAGMAIMAPVLSALRRAKQTGKGSYIDVSAIEASACVVGAELMDVQMNDRDTERRGNDQPQLAPHGVYGCAGEEQFMTLACRQQSDWRAICEVFGALDPNDSRYRTGADRWQNREELDRELRPLVKSWDRSELIDLLQDKGVPAGASLSNKDIFEDEHCRERALWWKTDHLAQGERWAVGVPWISSRTGRGAEPTAAPICGQHTREVLEGELGLTGEKVDDLCKRAVIKEATPPQVASPVEPQMPSAKRSDSVTIKTDGR